MNNDTKFYRENADLVDVGGIYILCDEIDRLNAENEQTYNLLLEGTNLLLNSSREILKADICIQKLEVENKRMLKFIQTILRANWKGYKDPVAEIQMLARRALEVEG